MSKKPQWWMMKGSGYMEVMEWLLVCDGLEGVHIDAIPGVVCEGNHCIDGGHE